MVKYILNITIIIVISHIITYFDLLVNNLKKRDLMLLGSSFNVPQKVL